MKKLRLRREPRVPQGHRTRRRRSPVWNPCYRMLSFSSWQVVSLVPRVSGLAVTCVVTINLVWLYGHSLCRLEWYKPDRKLQAPGSHRVPEKGHQGSGRAFWISLSGTFYFLSHLTSPDSCSVLPQAPRTHAHLSTLCCLGLCGGITLGWCVDFFFFVLQLGGR